MNLALQELEAVVSGRCKRFEVERKEMDSYHQELEEETKARAMCGSTGSKTLELNLESFQALLFTRPNTCWDGHSLISSKCSHQQGTCWLAGAGIACSINT